MEGEGRGMCAQLAVCVTFSLYEYIVAIQLCSWLQQQQYVAPRGVVWSLCLHETGAKPFFFGARQDRRTL